MTSQPRLLILMGSASDRQTLEAMKPYLEYFGLEADWRVSSAHRQPEQTAQLARGAAEQGYALIIAGAGLAAHLAGACAAHSSLPVIAVPLAASSLGGLDALLASVQMPAGVPVGVSAIGKAGAINAACLAARILALSSPEIKARVEQFRRADCLLPQDSQKKS